MGSISVQKVSKAYKQYPSRFGRLLEWLAPVPITRHKTKWVLQDVSFDVKQGEAVGIVGINGAGKSTLLKMITGTTQPTSGTIEMTGRLAAMLELGMGFHPDFTGRQNAVMAGQLLGHSIDEINANMNEIESFAEIGDAIDQPVRVYSSGMQMRLAFSVATFRRPDILIIDEALSVGDAYFQHKSFDRIRTFREAGTTLLIVSHDKSSIQAICDRAILLNAGRLMKEGSPEEIFDFYNALLADKEAASVRLTTTSEGKAQTVSGSGEASVAGIRLKDAKGIASEVVDVGSVATLEIDVAVHADIDELVVGYMIKDRLGQPIFGTNTHHLERSATTLRAGDRIRYQFTFPMNLGEGSYSIAIALHAGQSHVGKNYEWRDLAVVFQVVNMSRKKFVGCAWLEPEFNAERY
ncbi:ABC transporter ATP-binding protein [Paraburkholderia humisilvae]|uniref:Vitamin B12 import ATP-binding protein BtuD n=1 Tax=Paraburkholderia humisilvae TaxID=627669 RepID=A0A6J5E4B0_9BURK|nr:ABC transporter ATP-binding protein [Paraburkholderia humisilvae]CAB3760126.1 Vitamin B12 import ATP-binding protein BtuD [Paraburkholderia humisilvae]